MNLKENIKILKNELNVSIFAHFYQEDDVFEIADVTGDSLELAKQSMDIKSDTIIFCGVGFMGQSVKILSPQKKVYMPKIACCSMAKMISDDCFDESIAILNKSGIDSEDILPVTYINSDALVKAKVAKMGGMVCTSSNAKKIITNAMTNGKKIFFLPDRCLGQNIANNLNLKHKTIGIDKDLQNGDIICYNGFCSVHQLFDVDDIEFFKKRYDNILIISHPECDPSVCDKSDFVGSTSQIISFVKSLDENQKIAVATEFNLVNRLRKKNTYVLSATKPQCPTMSETTLEDVYNLLLSIKNKKPINEIILDKDTSKWAKISLERMFKV